MDREMENHIFQLLNALKEKMAIILVTHRIQSAKFADRIYIIEDGKTVTQGTPAELSKGDNLFSKSLRDAVLL